MSHLPGDASDTLPVHAVYGLRIASRFPFSHHLLPASGPPDVRFTVRDGPPPERPAGRVLWASPERGPDGEPLTLLTGDGTARVLRFHGVADFHFGSRVIDAVPFPGASDALIELRLLGPALAFHLECAGIAALHAAAVVLGGRAVAFAATNHGGKSSLAAALMQRGHPLLSDDVLPVEERDGAFVARPGYPQMRFWPAEMARFAGDPERFPRAHPDVDKRRLPVGDAGFGTFHPGTAPLAAVLVPERCAETTEARLEPLAPAQATLQLLACSFLPRLVAGAGLQPARMARLARLVESLPVVRLLYPPGYAQLPAAAAAVEDAAEEWSARPELL